MNSRSGSRRSYKGGPFPRSKPDQTQVREPNKHKSELEIPTMEAKDLPDGKLYEFIIIGGVLKKENGEGMVELMAAGIYEGKRFDFRVLVPTLIVFEEKLIKEAGGGISKDSIRWYVLPTTIK